MNWENRHSSSHLLRSFNARAILVGIFCLALFTFSLPVVWDLAVHIWRLVYPDWRVATPPGRLRSILPAVIVVLELVLIGTISAGYSKKYPMTQAITVAFLGPFALFGFVHIGLLVGYSSLKLLINSSVLPILFLLCWPVGIICSVIGAALRPTARKSTILLGCYSVSTVVLVVWRFSYASEQLHVLPSIASATIQYPDFVDPPTDHQPLLCSGYQQYEAGEAYWGLVGEKGCPRNYAAYGARPPSKVSSFAPGSQIPLNAVCCPLPASDIFTGEEAYVQDECPEGYVVTSGNDLYKCPECEGRLRCSQINLERYQLGPRTAGILSAPNRRPWRREKYISPYAIPAGLRYGMMRFSFLELYQASCLGYPFGSLLVGKQGKRCYNFMFRQLQFRGLPNDPPAGTPVMTYAQCENISDIFAERPMCIAKVQNVPNPGPMTSETEDEDSIF